MLVQLDSIVKTWRVGSDTVRAVDGISLTLDRGEFAVVLGPSGCGKSTMLHVAGGLLTPDSGTVTIDGQDLYQLSRDRRAAFRNANIGFVFQQFHLVPYLSVLDNVLAPSIASGDRAAGGRARELLEQYGLSHRMAHLPSELSAGERQRAAMARAMLNGPGLVLADEPTGNLDQENTTIVLDHLRKAADNNCAILMVTHDTSAVERADRVLRIRDGRLESESGTEHPGRRESAHDS